MKYNAPFGSADPNASYIDRNTPGAIRGSTPSARAVEHPQREILAVIVAAGLSPSEVDLTQLLQAIDQRIAAATGGEPDENYVLMPQARVRLPIFPEVTTADGKIPCLSPVDGTVRVPAGYTFIHRGIFSVTTTETDFATEANKTYHLRWNPDDGWSLNDVADSGYNPGAVAETSSIFDTAYDDALFSKVVTNGANVASITNLVNKDRIKYFEQNNGPMTFNSGANAANRSFVILHDYARTPIVITSVSLIEVVDGAANDHEVINNPINATSRYQTTVSLSRDFATSMGANVLVIA